MTKDCKHDYDIVSYTDLRRVCRLCKEPMPRPSDLIRERWQDLCKEWERQNPDAGYKGQGVPADELWYQALYDYLDSQAGFTQGE